MVVAMCVLSLQIISIHRENSLRKMVSYGETLPVPVATQEEETASEAALKIRSVIEDKRPRAVPSRKMRTPRLMKEFGRVLYDVPHDGNCGFWALLRGFKPNDELIRVDEIMELKHRSAKCAARTEFGPSHQEIGRMFGGHEWLDTAALPYVSKALDRDIIVSSSERNFGYDLFTYEGEAFHYDSIDEVHKEAANEKTIWLHNINNNHWTVAIPEDAIIPVGEESGCRETYFLINP
jgi:hypothetical protein